MNQTSTEICAAIKSELIVDVDPNSGVELTERLSRLVSLLPLSADRKSVV
jgi:hypothetical protein